MDDIKINLGGSPIKPQIHSKKEEETLKQISAKLHPVYDKDLIKMIQQIPKRERSKLFRDAIKKYITETDI